MTAPSSKALADFAEAVRLLAASPEDQQNWLASQHLTGLPEALALQFDDLMRIPAIWSSDLEHAVKALSQSLDRISQEDWSRPDLLQLEAWARVRDAAAYLLARIRTDISREPC